MFSIIIPTFNNFEYLKLCIGSLKKNSKYNHEIIFHINDGSDGTLNFVKSNGYSYTHSDLNIGLCTSINRAAKLSTTDYILYSHDDMYFCPNWDDVLIKEVKLIQHDEFYLSGTMIEANSGHIIHNFGETINNFREDELLSKYKQINFYDHQGSHFAPHLVSKKMWNKVGGFSEEFNPGDGSDPDLCMKLWLSGVRIFKGVSKFKVYHFNSLTTRNSKIKLNNGTKQFMFKYGFNPKFFRKHYLRGGNSIIPYIGKLNDPEISLKYFLDLLINKLKIFLLKLRS